MDTIEADGPVTETDVAETDAAPMSAEAQALAGEIVARIQRHQETARSKGNEGLASKWAIELRHLSAPVPIEALVTIAFNPAALDDLAIYAAQKVRRMVQAYIGVGRVDPYTEVVLKNALAMQDEHGRIPNRLVLASLTTKVKIAETLPSRRAAALETAATQASSSRKALIAVGAGRMEGRGRGSNFAVDFSHPFVVRALGA